MLEILSSIVQKVNAARDLEQALTLIVQRVKNAIEADVCSVYLTDFDKREHVLQATDGLLPQAVGRVRLQLHRGLVGLVCERAESINLDDATSHPRYLFTNETGEQPYHGFLGVPIIQHRKVLGVLVVRQIDPRSFHDDEETFLVTLAAQLAGAITHARASGELASLQGQETVPNRFLEGLPSANGVALGTAVVVYPPADLDAVPNRPAADAAEEEQALRAAVSAVVKDLRELEARVEGHLAKEDRALFSALLLMLDSDSLLGSAVSHIHKGNWAQGALRETIEEHAQVFDAMEDVYLRERASDVRDLGRRILMYLQRESSRSLDYPENTILVGEELSAIQLAEAPRQRLVGVVSISGSSASHIAILARGMGLPAVMGVDDLPVSGIDGREVIIDGYRGRIYVSPAPSVRVEYQRLADEDRALSAQLEALRYQPAETTDGVNIPLYLNTGLVLEANIPADEEAAGIGLYRTEVPFMIRDRFPSETVQISHYQRVLSAFSPRPVTLRTLDIGGDKALSYFPVEESNPFLGWRGIRISLDNPDIFMTQVRAMLRAAVGLNNLRLLLPMISTVGEVDDALLLIQRAYDELIEKDYKVSMPPIGVMIEVPAVVYQAEALARRVDFLSIGSNDLTQYLLAVDRNNPHVAQLYGELQPAVLRALKQVVDAGHANDREVSVCGEMAGNPLAVPLLLGLGVDSLSMSAGSLLRSKWVIRSCSRSRARELLQSALRYEDADAVRRLMTNALEALGLGGLVRPGK